MRPGPSGERTTQTITADQQAQALAADNVKIAFFWAHRMLRRCPGLELDDLVSTAQLGLLLAAIRYDPARCSDFGPWAGFIIRHQIMEERRRHQRLTSGETGSIDDLPGDPPAPGGDDPAIAEDADSLMAQAGLTDKERAVLRGRFWGGLTQAELARQMGVTRPCVQAIQARGLAKLRVLLDVDQEREGWRYRVPGPYGVK